MQISNQFDQFSELGQHEKSRRGIWSMRFDMWSPSEGHSPRAEYVAEEGSAAIALRRVEVGFQNSAEI